MIIERLQLQDFGIYGGHHAFNLAPDPGSGKPIVLIEGHNGAGKTTFLEAIRLALHGKAALGSRVSQKQYDAHLRERLHRGSEDRAFEIVLEIRRAENGIERLYTITRRWRFDRPGVDETLAVTVDGAEADQTREEVQDFLNDLVPPGVSQLFFFDGEKIQDIAHGDASVGLQQAIGPLLGLDLIEQLGSDLALFVARQKGDDSAKALATVARELTDIESELCAAEEKRAQLASECDQASASVRRAESTLRKEGGLTARDEEGARREQLRVEEERQELLGELRELASGIGPLLLAPTTLRRLGRETKLVEVAKAKLAANRLLNEYETQAAGQDGFLSSVWRNFRAFAAPEGRTLPRWSDGSVDYLRTRLAAAETFDRRAARTLGEGLDRNLLRTQAAADQVEAFAKGSGDIAFEAIRRAEFDRGRLSAALDEQDLVVARLRRQKDQLEGQRERLQNAVFEKGRLGRSASLAVKARSALIAYAERILAQRIGVLESYVLESLHKLLRRPTLVGRVALDRESFEVALMSGDDRAIALDSLSAGERQLFAVALLWALARTSERALPLVIDTPLGRLDRTHRQRIIDQYLAGASEQVVLLCTDTELTDEVADQLRPFVSRHLSLGVGLNEDRTRVSSAGSSNEHRRAYVAG